MQEDSWSRPALSQVSTPRTDATSATSVAGKPAQSTAGEDGAASEAQVGGPPALLARRRSGLFRTAASMVGHMSSVARTRVPSEAQCVARGGLVRLVARWQAHADAVRSLQVITEPRAILTCSVDGTVRTATWEGKQLGNLPIGTCLPLLARALPMPRPLLLLTPSQATCPRCTATNRACPCGRERSGSSRWMPRSRGACWRKRRAR